MPETTTTPTDLLTPDGRKLQVHEGGDPSGRPVVVHHGSPSAGVHYSEDAALAGERGLRLIGFDRAGYGGSDRRRGRRVADVATDVALIADALELERFATWGSSGGGPHALACAALLPDRCAVAISVSGVAPFGAPGLPWLDGMGAGNVAEFVAAMQGEAALVAHLGDGPEQLCDAEPEDLVPTWKSVLSPVDAETLTDEIAAHAILVMRHGLACGAGGWIDDDLAFLCDWGFAMSDIRVPTEIWHGAHDLMVPPAHGKWLAANVPGCDFHFYEDEGHMSLLAHHMPHIFDAIARYTF